MNCARDTRTLRAAVFAALLVLLAGLGQVLVTGRPLPLGTLAVAGVAVFAVAFALSGRERGYRVVAAVFLPLELGLSALFDLAQSTCPSLPPAPPGASNRCCAAAARSAASCSATASPGRSGSPCCCSCTPRSRWPPPTGCAAPTPRCPGWPARRGSSATSPGASPPRPATGWRC